MSVTELSFFIIELPRDRKPVPISNTTISLSLDLISTQDVFPPKVSSIRGIGNDPLTPQNFIFIPVHILSEIRLIAFDVYKNFK